MTVVAVSRFKGCDALASPLNVIPAQAGNQTTIGELGAII